MYSTLGFGLFDTIALFSLAFGVGLSIAAIINGHYVLAAIIFITGLIVAGAFSCREQKIRQDARKYLDISHQKDESV